MHPDDWGNIFREKSTVSWDGSLSLPRWGRIRAARCRRDHLWRLYRGRRVSGKPDTDMTSHPNNKSAEMSSAIDTSVLCRNVALTVAPWRGPPVPQRGLGQAQHYPREAR
jgi:hypothetical protein